MPPTKTTKITTTRITVLLAFVGAVDGRDVVLLLADAGAFTVDRGSVSGTERGGFSSAISFPSEILFDSRFRHTECARQRNFCVIVAIETGDVLFVRGSHCLLRLHYFYGIGDTRGEAIARLDQRLF